jgi:hypothetical protein
LPSSPSAILRREAARAAAAEGSVHGSAVSLRPSPRKWTLAATAAVLVAVGVGIGIFVAHAPDPPKQAASFGGAVLDVAADALNDAASAAAAMAPAVPVASASAPAVASAPPRAAGAKTVPARKPPPARSTELQANPYGQP